MMVKNTRIDILSRPQRAQQVRDLPPVTDWLGAYRCGLLSMVIIAGSLFWMLLLTHQQSQAAAPAGLGSLAGIVRDPTGNPLAAVLVTLFRQENRFVTSAYAMTSTNSAGAYSFTGLQTGIYKLRFVVPERCYFVQWHREGTTPETADPIIVTGNQVTGLASTVTTGSCLTGRVTLDADVLAHDGAIKIYTQGAFGWQVMQQVPIAPTGSYYSHALPPGVYRLCAQTEHPAATGCYGGRVLEQAASIPLTASTVLTNLDFAVAEGRFNSVISGVVTANGTPQAAIVVTLYQASTNSNWESLVYSMTDAAGRYQFDGLSAGFYRIGLYDPTGLFATTFYTDAISLAQAKSVALQNSAVISRLTMSMVEGGALQGKAPRYLSPGTFSYAFLYWLPSGAAVTDWQWSGRACEPNDQGEFSFDALPPGRYRVGFGEACLSGGDDCVYVYYGNASDLLAAQDIVIEAGKITKIDAEHDFAQSLFLPLIQQ
jgi:5-hydroxyisourate hydrolase-like protein (transthyretin family)